MFRTGDSIQAVATSIVGVLILCASTRATAQDAAEGADREAGTQVAPQPVRPGAVAIEAEEAEIQLEGAAVRIRQATRLRRLDKTFAAIKSRVETLDGARTRQVAGQLSGRRLRNAEHLWAELDDGLVRLRDGLAARAEEVQSERARVDQLEDLWRATEAAAADEVTYPDPARATIRLTLQHIESTRDAIGEALAPILVKQRRVIRVRSEVASTLAAIDDAQHTQRSELLERSHPPLWHPEAGEPPRWQAHIDALWNEHVGGIRRFVRRNLSHVLVHLGLAWFLAILLWRLARRTPAPAPSGEDDSSNEEGAVSSDREASLERPLSVALWLSLALTWLLHGSFPPVWSDVALLALLAATIRVQPPELPRAASAFVFASVFGDWLLRLAPESSWAGRLSLLVIALLLAAAAALAARRSSRGPRLVALWLATGAIASAAAEVLGHLHLAVMALEVTVKVAALLLALRTGTHLVRTVMARVLAAEGARSLHVVEKHHAKIERSINVLASVVAATTLVVGVLELLQLESIAKERAVAWLTEPLAMGALELTPESILVFAFGLFSAWLAARIGGALLGDELLPRFGVSEGASHTGSALFRVAILFVGFVFAAAAAGIELERLSLLIGALGVGIGFGLQNIVNNFVSGLILMLERPVGVGDTVEFSGTTGTVRDIGIRASVVESFDGSEMIVPNGDLISGTVTNWSRSAPLRRVSVAVGVAYGTDLDVAHDLLLAAATRVEGTLTEPEPSVVFSTFGASSIDFELRVWVPEFADGPPVRRSLATAAYVALAEAGIEIPFPQQDIHVKGVPGSSVPQAEPV